MKDALPLARKDSLIVKEVENETLVYDLTTDKAHCLNETAARVWKKCDGKTSAGDIANLLGADAKTKVHENVVWLALDQLEEFRLLEEGAATPVRLLEMTRRQMVQALGVAAALTIPVITSIVAPTAAMAASIPAGGCCDDKVDNCPPGYECSANNLPTECEKPASTGRSCQPH